MHLHDLYMQSELQFWSRASDLYYDPYFLASEAAEGAEGAEGILRYGAEGDQN